MNITELGAHRLRLTLRIMSDDELWGLLLDHPNQCLQEFWERSASSEKLLVPYPRTVRFGLWGTCENIFNLRL